MARADPPAAPLPAAQAGIPIARDVCCVECGYNLRGLAVNGSCPECGAAIGRSEFPDRLIRADRDWLGPVRLGLSVWALYWALFAVAGLARYWDTWVVSLQGLPPALRVRGALQWPLWVAQALVAPAVFLITRPEPRAVPPISRLRRRAIVVLACLHFAAHVCFPFVTAQGTAWRVMSDLVQAKRLIELCILLMIAPLLAECARRGPAPRLGRWTRGIKGATIVMMALVAGHWLLFRYRAATGAWNVLPLVSKVVAVGLLAYAAAAAALLGVHARRIGRAMRGRG